MSLNLPNIKSGKSERLENLDNKELQIELAQIEINNNCGLEILACQLQNYTNAYLYVIDDLHLNFFLSLDDVPFGNRQLEPATFAGPGNGYYIRDLNTQELICCFKEDLCKKLIGLSEDNQDTDQNNKKKETKTKIKNKKIRIINDDKKHFHDKQDKANSEPDLMSWSKKFIPFGKPKDHAFGKKNNERNNQKGKHIDMTIPGLGSLAPIIKTTKYI